MSIQDTKEKFAKRATENELECKKLEHLFNGSNGEEYKTPLLPEMQITDKGIEWLSPCKNNVIYRSLAKYGIGENNQPTFNDDVYVVIVDTKQFYYLWLKSYIQTDYPELCQTVDCEPIAQMPNNAKFEKATESLSRDSTSPVSIIVASLSHNKSGKPILHVTNNLDGYAKWLIYNGAESFPIEVRNKEQATLLANLIGINKYAPRMSSLI